MATLSLLSTLQQSPYFDDYDETKKFLRMLFQPSVSIQVRELIQLQTILQNQISRFGDAFYKDGSLVTGGQVSLDTNVHYIRVATNTTLANFVNQKIQVLNQPTVTADVIASVAAVGTDDPMLIVRYNGSAQISGTSTTIHIVGDTSTSTTTQTSGTITGLASIATIAEGIYYVNGFFVIVDTQTLVLEKQSATPTYKVGLTITESVTTSSDDTTLLDNAAGSYNVNASGANRYKISLVLDKKAITNVSDASFVEILRVENGTPTKIVNYPLYSELDNTLARRTFDESGNYSVRPFLANLNEHKGATGTTTASSTTTIDGLSTKFKNEFRVGDTIQLTNGSVTSASSTITAISSNTAMTINPAIGSGQTQTILNNDKVSVGLEPGKAYVRGYEYESIATEFVDIRKGRDTNTAVDFVVNTNFGNYFRIDSANNVFNIATQNVVDLHCVSRVDIVTGSVANYNKTKIGTTRVRQVDYFSGTPGTNGGTYDLYVYDTSFSSIKSNVATGSSTSAGTLTVELHNGTSSNVASAYVGGKIKMTSGLAVNQIRNITAQSGHTITVDKAFLTDIGSTDTCQIDFATTEIESIIESNGGGSIDKHCEISRLGKVDTLDVTSDTKIFETTRNSLVYELPQSVVKTLKPLTGSDFGYTVKRLYSGDSSTVQFTNGLMEGLSAAPGIFKPGGSAEVSLSTTDLLDNYIVAVHDKQSTARKNGDIVPCVVSSGSKIPAGGTSLNLDTGGGSGDTFRASIVATVVFDTAATGFRTKTIVNANTTTFDSTNNESTLRGKGQYAALITTGDAANTTISLKTSDIKSLKAVVKAPTTTFSSLTSSLFAAACASDSDTNNITSKYTFNSGQKDNYYDHGSITLKPGESAPVTPIVAVFDYFTHGTENAPFTVDTYLGASAGVAFADIPTFLSPTTGRTVNLRNCLDFRPKRTNGDVATNFALDTSSINGKTTILPVIPDADVVLNTDVEFYLPRKDKIVLSKNREFDIIEGIPSVDPVVPADDEDSMTLYIADVPEYTFNVTDITLQYIENKRFTMRDIGKLEKRIEQLEYYTSLSFLEKDAKDQPIFTDAGVERFKNGILVDQFSGHSIGDVVDSDYKVSIDYDQSTLRPSFNSENFKFDFSVSSSNIKKTGSLVTLAYTDSDFITQPTTTRTEYVNPYGATSFNGTLTLSPSSDTWFYQDKYADVLVNLEGQNDNWASGAATKGFGTQWDSWSKNWSGVEVNNDDVTKIRKKGSVTTISRTAKTIEQTISREGILSQNQPETIKKTVNNRIVNETIVPYSREQTILFKAEGLKPSTEHYIYIDDVKMRDSSQSAYKLSLTNPGDSTFVANEGEYVTVSVKDTPAINGTLIHTDYQGNSTLLIANTNGDWASTGTSTVVQATYVTSGGSTTANAALSVTAANTNFTSDVNGVLAGSMTLTAGQFRTGERLVRITDSVDNTLSSNESVAEKTFHIKGMENTTDGSIVSTRSALARREDIKSNTITKDSVSRKSSSVNFVNPMAQSFFVDETKYKNGIFLRNLTLYFLDKDAYSPITVQIRPMVSGVPSSSAVFPFAEKTLVPDQVYKDTTSPNAALSSSGTKFEFPSPVYLPPGEHAIVVLTNSRFYQVYTSVDGGIVTNSTTSNTKAGRTPEIGKFFITQNSSEWTNIKNRSMMFKLQKCSFQLTTSDANLCQFNIKPSPLSGATSDTKFDVMKLSSSDLKFSDTVLEYLYQNTKNSESARDTTFTKFSNNKNLIFDNTKKIRTNNFVSNLPDTLIQAQMATADSNVSPAIDLDRLNLITVENIIGNGEISDSDISIIKGGTGYSAGTVNVTGTSGTGGVVTIGVTGGVITSATVSSAGSGYFDDISITPPSGSGAVINIASELGQSGGNNKVRYITRRVSLEDGFDAQDLKVYLRAYKPSVSNIHVYYKVLSGNDSEIFDNKSWKKFSQETDGNMFSANESDFITYVYKTPNETAEYSVGTTTFKDFKTFAIKIVLSSSDGSNVPQVKDLRVIALDS